MNPAKVACIGEALAVLGASQLGPLERTESFTRSIGGAELNVAIGLAAQGVPALIMTRVGDDGFGRHIVASARSFGVDVSAVEVDPARSTGMYVKEVGGTTGHPDDLGPGASRMIYYRAGSASSAFSVDYLGRNKSLLADATIIHTTGITPALSDGARTMTLELATRRAEGQLLSFDVNWRPALWSGRVAEGIATIARIARQSDVVFLGASEASIVFGTTDVDQIRQALPEPRWVVVKNDGNEATGFDGMERFDVPALDATVTEPIGAGDAFAAGFLASLAEGRPLVACLENAHAIAVVALSTGHDHVGIRR